MNDDNAPVSKAHGPLVWPYGTYIGYCCQEWVMPRYIKPGRCGKCGQTPKFLRADP